jgi:hypothetical protein
VGEGRPRLGGLPSAGSNFILVTLAAVISDGPVLLRAPASCYEEWVHSGNEDAFEEIIAPDCPLYFGGMFMGTGPEAFKQTSTITYPAFPASGGPSTRSSPRGTSSPSTSPGAARTRGSSWECPHWEQGGDPRHGHGALPRGQDRRDEGHA